MVGVQSSYNICIRYAIVYLLGEYSGRQRVECLNCGRRQTWECPKILFLSTFWFTQSKVETKRFVMIPRADVDQVGILLQCNIWIADNLLQNREYRIALLVFIYEGRVNSSFHEYHVSSVSTSIPLGPGRSHLTDPQESLQKQKGCVWHLVLLIITPTRVFANKGRQHC